MSVSRTVPLALNSLRLANRDRPFGDTIEYRYSDSPLYFDLSAGFGNTIVYQ